MNEESDDLEIVTHVRLSPRIINIIDDWVVVNRDAWETRSQFIRGAIIRADRALRAEGMKPRYRAARDRPRRR